MDDNGPSRKASNGTAVSRLEESDPPSAKAIPQNSKAEEAPPHSSGPRESPSPSQQPASSTRPGGAPRVVGIGASAGGLEALEAFFNRVPSDTGLAFVVVQHLSPDFKSLMDQLLSRHTSMRVSRATHRQPVEPNCVYVIPPGVDLRLAEGRLLLSEKKARSSIMPIDLFLGSLAEDQGRSAVAVILSGTGTDGSAGVRAVSERGGLVLVQQPSDAKFNGMPCSAIDTGLVDITAPSHELPEQMLNALGDSGEREKHSSAVADSSFERVLSLLHREHGIDFTNYKPNTIRRRIERRAALRRCVTFEDYQTELTQSPTELETLYHDLLIGVTKFFRDAEAFEFLDTQVLPKLLDEASSKSREVRVWVAGCATGEEAYSLAILFREHLERRKDSIKVRIFATDVHRSSLEQASTGVYGTDALDRVPTERVERHFKRLGNGFEVVPEVRHMVVFAPHDILRDAPFTRLDLVTCRNVLIYLQPQAQHRALSLMHFGLRAGGVLFLGPSETCGELSAGFDTLDRHWKLFTKSKRSVSHPRVDFERATQGSRTTPRKPSSPEPHVLRALQSLVRKHSPPAVLVNRKLEVLHTFSGGRRFLQQPDGRPSLNLLDMVDGDLKLTLHAALQRAAKVSERVAYSAVKLADGAQTHIHVERLDESDNGVFLIELRPQSPAPPLPDGPEANIPAMARDRISSLEEQLQYSQENLQATLEEMETANEELQATNEELVASNEELQSTNEELHSVNEELYTVNSEHQDKIDQLTELTEDMENLFAATDVGTVFLDKALNIRRFTPKLARLFQLLPQDVGRPIGIFISCLNIPNVVAEMERVLTTREVFEQQAQDRLGNWYLVRIIPYVVRRAVDGVVLSIVDIGTLKATEARLRLMSKVFKNVADPVLIEDAQGNVVDMNPEAERVYGWARKELLGKNSSCLVPPENVRELNALRMRCLTEGHVRDVEMPRLAKNGSAHPALVSLSRVVAEGKGSPLIATITKDITERKLAEQAARVAIQKRDEFLAMLSHELRNPLYAIQNAAQLLGADPAIELRRRSTDVITRQIDHMARLLEDLLEVSRVTQGRVELNRRPLILQDCAREAIESLAHRISAREQTLEVDLPEEPLFMLGDRSRIRQVHENLLSNASKYAGKGGRIKLTLEQREGQAVLGVADDGMGIEKRRLEEIFELFRQGAQNLDRSDAGLGVGLTLVRSLAELHGGRAWAESDGLGKGSTFRVTFPLMAHAHANAPPQEPEARADSSTATGAHGDPLEVLIVEDNDDARQTLAELLRLKGYRVRTAIDGQAGLNEVESQSPQVALIDIGLPRMDGFQLAQKIRSLNLPRRPQLIALTGYGQYEDRKAVKKAGFDHHLIKPVQQTALLDALERAAQR